MHHRVYIYIYIYIHTHIQHAAGGGERQDGADDPRRGHSHLLPGLLPGGVRAHDLHRTPLAVPRPGPSGVSGCSRWRPRVGCLLALRSARGLSAYVIVDDV